MPLALPLALSPLTLSPRSALAFPQPPPLRRLRELFDAFEILGPAEPLRFDAHGNLVGDLQH